MSVKTCYGILEGMEFPDYSEYRKVPYAKPPVGNLRFRRPQKPDAWEGIYRAVEYAPCCMQDSNRAGEPWGKDFYADSSFMRPMSEDCLYLNIWVPKDLKNPENPKIPENAKSLENPMNMVPDQPYPVALWIHGGAFLGGYATELEFDGAEYARRGVILVSVEYRCNIFGYLAHPWLSAEAEAESGRRISGNYGSYDQLAALEWVMENIAAFGGDPDNITVFGQSAGAMSTQTLVSSSLAEGIIAKAILQSGGSYGIGLHRDLPLAEAEHYGEALTELLEVKNLEELRQIPAEVINEKLGAFTEKVMPEAKGLFMTPCIDGELLTEGYYQAIDDSHILDIPYMIGWTKDDIDVMAPDRAGNPENTAPTMLAEGSIAFSWKLYELGRKAAFVYSFDRELPGDGWGAFHSAELFYMFGTLSRTWRPFEERDYQLSKKMLDYWTNFMKTGDPNGNNLPEWKRCTREAPVVMKLE